TPFINNSIFKMVVNCPIVKRLYERMISMQITEQTSKMISLFSGPRAYTQEISNYLAGDQFDLTVIEEAGQIIVSRDNEEFMISNLFGVLGTRSEWPKEFSSIDWEYKKIKGLNWQDIGD